jgi:hypothetical protein
VVVPLETLPACLQVRWYVNRGGFRSLKACPYAAHQVYCLHQGDPEDAVRPHYDRRVRSLGPNRTPLDNGQGATSGGPLAEVDSQTDQLAAAEEPAALSHTETAAEGPVTCPYIGTVVEEEVVTWSRVGIAVEELATRQCIAVVLSEGTRDSWAGGCDVQLGAGRCSESCVGQLAAGCCCPLASPCIGGSDLHTESPRSPSLPSSVSLWARYGKLALRCKQSCVRSAHTGRCLAEHMRLPQKGPP